MYNLKIEKNEAVALTIFQVFQIVSATAPSGINVKTA